MCLNINGNFISDKSLKILLTVIKRANNIGWLTFVFPSLQDGHSLLQVCVYKNRYIISILYNNS